MAGDLTLGKQNFPSMMFIVAAIMFVSYPQYQWLAVIIGILAVVLHTDWLDVIAGKRR